MDFLVFETTIATGNFANAGDYFRCATFCV